MTRLNELTTAELIGLAEALWVDAHNYDKPLPARKAAEDARSRCWEEIDRRANAVRDSENYHLKPGDQLPGGITITAEDIARARYLNDSDWENCDALLEDYER